MNTKFTVDVPFVLHPGQSPSEWLDENYDRFDWLDFLYTRCTNYDAVSKFDPATYLINVVYQFYLDEKDLTWYNLKFRSTSKF